MCCRECCTCDCCDEREDDDVVNQSLQEFLDCNNNPDAQRLTEFLTFFKNYNDPLVSDKEWYTHERLMYFFDNLGLTL